MRGSQKGRGQSNQSGGELKRRNSKLEWYLLASVEAVLGEFKIRGEADGGAASACSEKSMMALRKSRRGKGGGVMVDQALRNLCKPEDVVVLCVSPFSASGRLP
jgi:hypothetical protein